MLSVSEATDWTPQTSAHSKYKALCCGIHHVPKTSPEYEMVTEHVIESISEYVNPIHLS